MKKYYLIAMFYYLLPGMLWGQIAIDTAFLKIAANFLTQLTVYPQEKLHLHTDRDIYMPGEKIWFKAYITDAETHRSSTNSHYIYAELIDANDSLVNRVMIRPENDMFYGHLPVSNTVSEGNYTLRAYTRYMENLGDDYFFKKNIRIVGNGGSRGSGGNRGNGEQVETARRGERLSPEQGNRGNDAAGRNARQRNTSPSSGGPGMDFDVSFFPEGGHLVEGSICKVAFKALNKDGYAENISGEIMDEQGSQITAVQTFYAGMGAFVFVPAQGKKYFLKCRNEDGIEKQFELPPLNLRACSLTAGRRPGKFVVEIKKPTLPSVMPSYLLGHYRGMVFYFSALDKGKEFCTFAEDALPAGVLQFVLFDAQMNPLSERLVFSKNNATNPVEFHTDKNVYQIRDKIVATLALPPSILGSVESPLSEREVLGHVSVAVTDDQDMAIDSSTTILSTLLLSSELKGYIENPAYYLQDDVDAAIALDYLMLTHGWRRYNIPEVVKGNYKTPQIPFQTSREISGKVRSYGSSRPVAGSELFIMAKDGDFGLVTTDANGSFVIDNSEYPDSTAYILQTLGKTGNNHVELVLNEESFPKLIYALQSLFSRQKIIDIETKDLETKDAFVAKAEQRSKYDEDMRLIQLSEVVVTAPRIERKEEPRLQHWMNYSSDLTIRKEELEKKNPRLVADWLRGIPGVSVLPEGVILIRGGLPLVLIDGIPMEWPKNDKGLIEINSPYESPLENISVQDVESIDIIKNSGMAMFGARGSHGGAISITTKKGIDESIQEDKHNQAVYTPLGYQKPVAFYSPQYETLEARYQSIPDYRTTIFWKPDIVISEEGEAGFVFFASDFPTTYSMIIEGLTTDGRIIRQVEKIQVK